MTKPGCQSSAELRAKWKAFFKKYDKVRAQYEEECKRLYDAYIAAREHASPFRLPKLEYPPWPDMPFPDEFRGLTCGAKTRAGTPCKLTSLYTNGRCKFHGGLSTGPRTPEGKRRSAMNGFKRTP